MPLTAYFAARSVPDRGPAACGVVLFDQTSARSISETGVFLGESVGDDLAPVQALLKTIDLVEQLDPDHLELRCPHTDLIEQITTADPTGRDAVIDAHNHAMMRLLSFDHWHIAPADPADLTRPRELAEQALREGADRTDLSHTDAATQQHAAHTGVPQWTVELLEDPGPDCPARCAAGTLYPFGPDTPAGFCVHAARIALDDGPLDWEDPDQKRMTTLCPFCEVPMRIRLVQ